MKLKEIENPVLMRLNELKNLFMGWFPNGISKEEGWVLYSIFSDNYRWLHLPSNKIIETGTMRFFSFFLSEICNEETNYGNFYMSRHHIDNMNLETIKRVHKIIELEVEYIEDYWNEKNKKIREALYIIKNTDGTKSISETAFKMSSL